MKKHVCLSKNEYFLKDYSLVTLRENDAEKIRKWRNEQIDYLRQKKKISKNKQIEYFKTDVERERKKHKPNSLLFSYLLNQECIGYGGLTNIDWDSKKAEISFLVDTNRYLTTRLYYEDFVNFLNLIMKISFQELKLNRLFTETYDIRPAHIKILEEIGFQLEGKLKQHVNIKGRYVDSLIHGYLQNQFKKQKNFH